MNINTREYWERKFAIGDWQAKGGRDQTASFARTHVRYLPIPSDFSGTILDFGCALGDALPVYRAAYRRASLIGMDISGAAIAQCQDRYGAIARFVRGDYTDVPPVDVIIASNVFEHLSNDRKVAAHLLTKCHDLFIVTPYREAVSPGMEHVNCYRRDSFRALDCRDCIVFPSRGWSPCGWNLWFHIYLKNAVRSFWGKPIVRRPKQIMFHLSGTRHGPPLRLVGNTSAPQPLSPVVGASDSLRPTRGRT